MNFQQLAALDDFAPWLLRHRAGLFSSYADRIGPHIGEVRDPDVLQELAVIESFAKAFNIELPELSLDD